MMEWQECKTDKVQHRYVVFGFYDYYPEGGMMDARGSFKTMDEAKAFAASEMEECSRDGYQIWDTRSDGYWWTAR